MENFIKHKGMFFDKVIEPFIQPFYQLSDYVIVKMFLLTGFLSGKFFGLFTTPESYFYTLTILIILDAAAKTTRIIFVKSHNWSFDLFIRKSLYKVTSYSIILTAITVFSNQWEADSNYLQYIGYSGLCALELWSVGRHFKIVGFFVAVFEQMRKGKFDYELLKKEMEEYTVRKEKELHG